MSKHPKFPRTGLPNSRYFSEQLTQAQFVIPFAQLTASAKWEKPPGADPGLNHPAGNYFPNQTRRPLDHGRRTEDSSRFGGKTPSSGQYGGSVGSGVHRVVLLPLDERGMDWGRDAGRPLVLAPAVPAPVEELGKKLALGTPETQRKKDHECGPGGHYLTRASGAFRLKRETPVSAA